MDGGRALVRVAGRGEVRLEDEDAKWQAQGGRGVVGLMQPGVWMPATWMRVGVSNVEVCRRLLDVSGHVRSLFII